MWRSTRFSLIVGILGVVLLVVDETKSVVTYVAAGALIVIGAGLVVAYVAPERRA